MLSHHENREVDESQPLIVRANNAPTRAQWWASTITKIFLGGVGIGAGALYLGPAQTCADDKNCGLWLSNLIGRQGAVIVFTAGGADFSAGAVFMGAKSAEVVKYINEQPTVGKKVGKSFLIVTVAASQNVPLLLAALSTSPELWQILLTVGGNLPGSFYGTLQMGLTEIPYFMSKARVLASNLRHAILDKCWNMTEAEKRQWLEVTHYRIQHATFLDSLDARWDHILRHASALQIDNSQDPLALLFSQQNVTPDRSWLARGTHWFGRLTGFYLGLNFSAGGVSNTLRILSKYIPTLPLQIATTLILSASQLYANLRLAMDGVTSVLDTLVDVVRGKPIKSFAFQLRPKTTLLVGGLSLTASALSYAVIAVIFLNEFGNKDPNQELSDTQKSFLYGAMSGINIYHFASIFHLYYVMFSAMTRNEKEQFLFTLKQEVERLKKMPEKDFIEFVKGNSSDENARLGLSVYQAPAAVHKEESDIDVVVESTDKKPDIDEEIGEPKAVVVNKADKSESKSSWWCCWYSKKKADTSPSKEITEERRFEHK